jgi:uncharacterized protein (DUF2235 family)
MPTSLIICCDGTWNSADRATTAEEICVTNVLKLACRVEKHTDKGALQIVYYDQGVGTGNLADRIAGGTFGEGLEANIHDAYRFLVANYEPDDHIYIFGFSRGAYTARSLAGMIRRCGILRRDKVRHYPTAKHIYRTARNSSDPAAMQFRTDAAIEPDTPIHFVGVWDTVGALGIPLRAFGSKNKRDFEFLDTSLSPSIRHAYHALAIDEHRKPFGPTLWDSPPDAAQTVKQVWFAGAHSDVGGGYKETGLSDHALLWMMDAAKGAGLEFDDVVLKALPTQENHKQAEHDSRKGVYNLQPALHRPIGATPHGTEYLHRSVIERWRDVPAYRPKSLEPHAARITSILAGPLTEPIYALR